MIDLKLETFAIVLLITLAGLFAGWYVYHRFGSDLSQQVVPAPATAPSATSPATPPAASPRQPLPARYPVALPAKVPDGAGGQPTAPPYPDTLDQSDSYLKERLPQLIDNKQLFDLLDLKNFIRRLVIIIDALPSRSLPLQHLPIRPPKSAFRTVSMGETLTIDPRNARRYTPYVKLADAISDDMLLRIYQGLYPLFQKAYLEMGKPNAHFNDRLVMVIDQLLATPEVHDPIVVVRHVNRFKYADPRFEGLSAGQKILLRMGPDNARRIKDKLRRFRQGLVGR